MDIYLDRQPKPELSDIADYFSRRLQGKQKAEKEIFFHRDEFGNTVFQSPTYQEFMPGNKTLPATITVSEQGRSLINQNHGLLRRIAEGELNESTGVKGGEFIGGGKEGKVYKVKLMTSDGYRDFAIKYSFPTQTSSHDIPGVIFTPGIDQMKLCQWAKLNLDNKCGINIVSPVIATHDITVTPYIPDTIDARSLFNYLQEIPPESSDTPLPAYVKEFIDNQIRKFDKNRIQFIKFFYLYIKWMNQGVREVYSTLDNARKSQNLPQLISPDFRNDIYTEEQNLLIDLTAFQRFFDDFQKTFQNIGTDTPPAQMPDTAAFQFKAQNTGYITDLILGFETK